MPSAEERLAHLEGRVQEHGATLERMSNAIDGVRTEIALLGSTLRAEIGSLRAEIGAEIGSLRAEIRAQIASEVGTLRGEMGAMRTDLRGEIAEMRREMTTGFRWLIGLLVVGGTTIVGGLITLYVKLAP